MLGWLWSTIVSSSQCGWLWWKIKGKGNGCTWTYPVCFLKDTPKWLVIQAVRYGSLKFRGKVKAGNRYMSISFCPLRLCKSSLIRFSHGGPPNTWGQPWRSLTPPHGAAWRLSTRSLPSLLTWGQSSKVVESLATQSMVRGPAALPGSCEKCRISFSPQIY